MMCGEMDPLVDDTVLLAGRIRQARQMYRQKNPQDVDFPCGDNVSVKFLEGISHAFLQMMPFLPEARQAVKTVGDWMMELVERPVDSDLHLATIITDEKEMLRRRKAKLIKSLY
jgi:acetyl esterase/lipase